MNHARTTSPGLEEKRAGPTELKAADLLSPRAGDDSDGFLKSSPRHVSCQSSSVLAEKERRRLYTRTLTDLDPGDRALPTTSFAGPAGLAPSAPFQPAPSVAGDVGAGIAMAMNRARITSPGLADNRAGLATLKAVSLLSPRLKSSPRHIAADELSESSVGGKEARRGQLYTRTLTALDVEAETIGGGSVGLAEVPSATSEVGQAQALSQNRKSTHGLPPSLHR